MDGGHKVVLPLHLLGRLLLLARLGEPLEVIRLEGGHLRVLPLLGDRNRLLPLVQLLVHFHRVLDEALLQQELLGAGELPVEHRKLRLDSEVARPGVGNAGLRLDVCDEIVDLVEVARLGDVAHRAEAPLGGGEILTLESELGELLPHRLGLRCELEALEHRACPVEVAVLDRGAKGD